LQDRAAALLQSGRYLPLPELTDSFYAAQHEAAYIEAGAFVEFLAGRYGRERVWAMYRDAHNAGSLSAELDAMLREHFQASLAETEEAWLDSLRARTPDPETVRDVEFTLRFFDTLRRYQRANDPGAQMNDLWLPDLSRARAEQITADYLPSPATAESITLEVMFRAARKAAEDGAWAKAEETLSAVEEVMDARERRTPDPISVSQLSETYHALVNAILRAGDEPLSIELLEDCAVAETRDPGNLQKEVQRWDTANGYWARGG
jgi:hypothetical protein